MRLFSLTVTAALALVASTAAPALAGPTSGDTRSGTTAAASLERQPSRPVSPTASAGALALSGTDVGPVPGLVPTRIHWTRWSTRVVHGNASTLEGQVTDEGGAIPDALVELYARPAGASSWTLVGASMSDDEDGIFRFTHEPAWTTDYRVVFEGDLLYGRSQGTRHVDVVRRVPSEMTGTTSPFTFTGRVAPGYANRTVRLQRKTSATGAWSTVASQSTSSTSRWSFRVSGPATSGTWYYRALVPADSRFVASHSATWGIRRR